MQILISCAKTMGHTPVDVPETSIPHFVTEAENAVRQLMKLSPEDIAAALKVNQQLAAENARRYADFFAENTPEVPALLAYTGIVFQQIGVNDFSLEDLRFAQDHMFITSFLYGLLRPLDLIRPYRLEGNVKLEDGKSRFDYWKPLLTDFLIEKVKADDGILVNLASAEMKKLFDWKKVCKEVKVLTPDFKTIQGERERSIVIYTKMSRGQMTRFILKNHLVLPEELSAFEPDIADAAVVMHLQ